MDLKRLDYFTRIAELGSVSQAAERLRISQPSLSRQMRLLEEELGVKLFNRHRRGMTLTREGEELQARIGDPLRLIEHALRDIRSLADETRANLVIGVPPTVGYVLAGPVARRVAADAPHISLRIVEGYAGNLASSIGRGEIDMALLYGPSAEWASMEWAPDVEHLELENLLVEDLMLVGPSESPLDPGGTVDLETLAELPLMLPSPRNRPYGVRRLVEKIEKITGHRLVPDLEADTLQLTKDFLESGLGYAVLPYSSISREIEGGRLKYARIDDPEVNRLLVLGQVPNSRYPRQLPTLKTLILREIGDLVASGKWSANLLFDPDALG